MALLGRGALVIWHEPVPEAEVDYNEWHSKEHMLERVGVPGFRRGHRYIAVAGTPRYFNLYEVDELATLSSKPYLDRLNDPTDWTRRVVPTLRDNNRTLCRVVASCGAGGVPALWAMILLAPAAGRADGLRAWLGAEALPRVTLSPGVLGAHLLQGDQAASGALTQEKRLRAASGQDEIADWVILLGGYDQAALDAVMQGELGADRLAERGAASSRVRGIYRLVHCVTEADLPAG